MAISRRKFITALGTASALSLGGAPLLALGASRQVVVIGGGIGGATAARQIRMIDPAIAVTLIEPKQHYHTCFMSNEVLSGRRKLASIRFDYTRLKELGIKVIHDKAANISPDSHKITTNNGTVLSYDRCILAPGIDFRWDQIEGFDAKTAQLFPHAWQAGQQTATLQAQLREMADGGTVIITAPAGSMRAAHAPYERASQIAHYLKQHKPRSRVLIFDAKTAFPQQALFLQAWQRLFGYGAHNSLIEWHGGTAHRLIKLDATTRTITTAAGELHRGDVLNIISPQRAGHIAAASGLTDESGWCPVDLRTFESTRHKGIHIIGDACIASPMQKLGSAANSQAKACANAVASLLNGREPAAAVFTDVAYSTIEEAYAFSTVGSYRLAKEGNRFTLVAGGASPIEASTEDLKREAAYARSWFNNLTKDTFG